MLQNHIKSTFIILLNLKLCKNGERYPKILLSQRFYYCQDNSQTWQELLGKFELNVIYLSNVIMVSAIVHNILRKQMNEDLEAMVALFDNKDVEDDGDKHPRQKFMILSKLSSSNTKLGSLGVPLTLTCQLSKSQRGLHKEIRMQNLVCWTLQFMVWNLILEI